VSAVIFSAIAVEVAIVNHFLIMVVSTVLRFVSSEVLQKILKGGKCMNNVIELLNEDLQNHRAEVILPGEKGKKSLYLLMLAANVSRLDDFKKTYGDKVTDIHIKIAEKLFGKEKTENVYGVFVDENLKMVFAFNREFADYDSKKKEVVFKNIDDILLDKINSKEKESPTKTHGFDDVFTFERSGKNYERPRRPGGGGLMRYSLIEKKK
jgi:hypothetical protein